jgi:hypothetical protein
MATYTFGDFDYATVTGAFEPNLADIDPLAEHHGTVQIIEYVYGFVQGEDGSVYCAEQKFVGSLNSGTFVMTNKGGGSLDVHPITTRTHSGELRRTIEPDLRRWSDPIMARLPKHALREGDLPYLLEVNGRDVVWDQGELLHLEGTCNNLGVQFFALSKEEPLFFTSLPYWVTGTMLGEKVTGLLYFDRVHARAGKEWKETTLFKDIQVCWHIFGNTYDDGSVEFGKIVKGKRGFNLGVVVEGMDLVASGSTVDSKFQLDEAGFVDSATFAIGEKEWIFTGPDAGKMAEFSASRWANYRAQYGTTRRTGDTRTPESSFTWMESFADRIESEGLKA